MYNAPSGTFTVAIKDGGTTIFSDTFDSAEIKSDLSTSDNYAWLWKAFSFTSNVYLKPKSYTIELSSSGYTFSESSYLALVKDWETDYQQQSPAVIDDRLNPFAFQLFEYRDEKLWDLAY